MNKDGKIWEWSDSEFLSFLYTERDREYSKHSEWGVNFWVVGAAIIGLLGYAYHAIAKDYDLFDWRLFVFYSTVLGALIICGMLLLSPVIQGRRWVNKNRVTTIGRNAPIVFMTGKTVIAVASIIFLKYWGEYGIVFWLWIVFLFITEGTMFYLQRNRSKLIKVERRGNIFVNNTIEWIYRAIQGLICFAISVVAICTWGTQYLFGEKEFEMSCVFAIIVGIIWFVCYYSYEKRYRSMDWWIDQYVYGNLTKRDACLYLLEYSQEYDIVDVIRDEYEKIRPLQGEISKWREKHKEYLCLIKNGKLNYDDSHQYIGVMRDELDKSQRVLNKLKVLHDRIKEVLQLDVYSSLDLFKKQMDDIEIFEDNVLKCIDESKYICNELDIFVTSFMCTKYGGLCGVQNCEHRNEKPSILYRIKRVFKLIVEKISNVCK